MSKVKAQMSKLKKLPNSGFSLIELMVVMAIIAILIATAFVNFGKNADRDIRLEAERFTTFVRDVQNRALTGEIEGISEGNRHLCGFGLHQISSTEIIVYYRFVGNAYYGLNMVCSDNASTNYINNTESPEISRFAFSDSKGVTAKSFKDIFFLLPSGTVYQDNVPLDDLGLSAATIGLTLSGSSGLAVEISSGGLVKYE